MCILDRKAVYLAHIAVHLWSKSTQVALTVVHYNIEKLCNCDEKLHFNHLKTVQSAS